MTYVDCTPAPSAMRALLGSAGLPALALSLLAAPASAQLATWEAAPALPCGVSSLAPAHADGTLLAATACGAFRLEGDVWTRLGDLEQPVEIVRQAPDGDVFAMRTGTSTGRLYRFDGAAWTLLRDATTTSPLASLAITPHGTLVVGFDRRNGTLGGGLIVSSDHGQTWADGGFWGSDVSIVRVVGDVALAGVTADMDFPAHTIYRSTNGATWEPVDSFWGDVPPFAMTLRDVAVTSEGTLVAGVRTWDSAGVRRSTDGGMTWTAAVIDVPHVTSIVTTDAGVVAAAGEAPFGLVISTDDGASFSPLPSTLDGRRPESLVAGADGRLYAIAHASPEGPPTVMRTVGLVAGESGPEPLATLRVGPNPATEELNVSGATSKVEVLDVQGRVVRRASAGASRIGLAGLAPGVYVVRAGGQSVRVVVVGR